MEFSANRPLPATPVAEMEGFLGVLPTLPGRESLTPEGRGA